MRSDDGRPFGDTARARPAVPPDRCGRYGDPEYASKRYVLPWSLLRSSQKNLPQKGGGEGLTRGGFYQVLIVHTLFPQVPQRLSPRPSCGCRHGPGPLADGFGPWGYHRPGCGDKAPLWHGVLAQQRPEQPHPALANHAPQPQTGRPSRPRALRTPACHVEPGADGDGRVCGPAHTEPPSRRDRPRQPQARRALWVTQARAVPLPPRAPATCRAPACGSRPGPCHANSSPVGAQSSSRAASR